MNNKNKALINYYARLIQKNQRTIEDVPEELRDSVQEVIKSLPPIEVPTTDKSKEESK